VSDGERKRCAGTTQQKRLHSTLEPVRSYQRFPVLETNDVHVHTAGFLDLRKLALDASQEEENTCRHDARSFEQLSSR